MLHESAEKAVRERLAKTCPNLKCAACGGDDLVIGGMNVNFFTEEHTKGPVQLHIGGGDMALAPYVSLTCRFCACTIFFSAVQLGLVPPEE